MSKKKKEHITFDRVMKQKKSIQFDKVNKFFKFGRQLDSNLKNKEIKH